MHKTTHNYTLQKLEVYASWIVPARKIKICHIFGIKRPKKSCFVFSFCTTYIVFSRDWNTGPVVYFKRVHALLRNWRCWKFLRNFHTKMPTILLPTTVFFCRYVLGKLVLICKIYAIFVAKKIQFKSYSALLLTSYLWTEFCC